MPVKVGDMVRILLPPGSERRLPAGWRAERGKQRVAFLSSKTGKEAVGVILDVLENADGFWDYEVLVENEKMWFPDLQLEVTSEGG